MSGGGRSRRLPAPGSLRRVSTTPRMGAKKAEEVSEASKSTSSMSESSPGGSLALGDVEGGALEGLEGVSAVAEEEEVEEKSEVLSEPGVGGGGEGVVSVGVAPGVSAGLSMARSCEKVPRSRQEALQRALEASPADVSALRSLAWKGCPPALRGDVWRLLLGYMPAHKERRRVVLCRKRQEYHAHVRRYFGGDGGAGSGSGEVEVVRSDGEQSMLRQILKDVNRTGDGVPLVRCEAVQRALERLLYIWAVRHPAAGYVQGLNDVALPFLAAFCFSDLGVDLTQAVEDGEGLREVEADVFWCLSRMLDSVQDWYTVGQPGLHRQVHRLQDVITRLDKPLADHLEHIGVRPIQFAARWVNCLLVRELPLPLAVRLWDSYVAEGAATGALEEQTGFAHLHAFVCAAMLLKFADKLRDKPMEVLMPTLQAIPKQAALWDTEEIAVLLANAYVIQSLLAGSTAHLKATTTPSTDHSETPTTTPKAPPTTTPTPTPTPSTAPSTSWLPSWLSLHPPSPSGGVSP